MSRRPENRAAKYDIKSGFVAIAGAPNSGKSTLLNRMLGKKISITSGKPQTTRHRILGVVQRTASQMVFIDTPGVHRSNKALNVRIVEQAVLALNDVDMALFLVDAAAPDPESEEMLLKKIKGQKKSVVLALNKIDLIKKPALASILEIWSGRFSFAAVIPVSARHGTGVEILLQVMEKNLPSGPAYFPEDVLTDMPERFIAAEMIREKVFRFTSREVPYSTAVTVENFTKKKNLLEIHAEIHVEHDSQKGIVIGKNGARLKKIGSEARKEIERMTGNKVFLKLFIRVRKNWSKDAKAIRRFGY